MKLNEIISQDKFVHNIYSHLAYSNQTSDAKTEIIATYQMFKNLNIKIDGNIFWVNILV